jgi:hypothetical protein
MTRDRTNPDPRHGIIKGLLDSYWLRENPVIPSLPWGPADAGALGQFLRANPKLSTDVVAQCLENRLRSKDHAPAERVYRWIGDLLRYVSGPLNKYKQPMRDAALYSEASVGSRPAINTKWEDKEWQAEALRKRAAGEELDWDEIQYVWLHEAEERGEL